MKKISAGNGRRWYLSALFALAAPILCLASLWALAALYFSPLQAGLRLALCGLYIAIPAICFLWSRSLKTAAMVDTLLLAIVIAWWWTLAPSNDRSWQADVKVLPGIEFNGDQVLIKNIRDFSYASEFDYQPHYIDAQYSLRDLRTLDLFLIHWGSPAIAHTILSFGFGDDHYVAVSIETRKEIGQEYSAIRGFFRQFTLIYVVATERDVIRLRTDLRKEDVYLYRLRAKPEFVREVFMQYAAHINRLRDRAEWYNALSENCTTSIRKDIYAFVPNKSFDWRLLANGYIDEMLYERGSLDTRLPFAELKRRSYINPRAQALPAGADYSTGIRKEIPGIDL